MPISEVFNRDCMEAMKEFPDNHFSLSIVDPPYGMGAKVHAHENITWNDDPPSKHYFDELRRVSSNQIIWGANNFNGHIPERGRIVWNKLGPDIGRRNTGFRYSDCEIASQTINDLTKMFSYTWIGNVRGNDYQVQWNSKTLHPSEKPIALYKWLLQNYAKPGDTILDTHLGSGSSRIAAYDLGFDFTGYELDKDYFEAQEKRFADHIAQPKLFTPEAVTVEQSDLFI